MSKQEGLPITELVAKARKGHTKMSALVTGSDTRGIADGRRIARTQVPGTIEVQNAIRTYRVHEFLMSKGRALMAIAVQTEELQGFLACIEEKAIGAEPVRGKVAQEDEAASRWSRLRTDDDFRAFFDPTRRILYWAVLIATYSLLEEHLNAVCRSLGALKPESLGVSDLRGEGIERAKLYLRKIGKCSGTLFADDKWSDIKMLQAVRNVLVHNSGLIRERPQAKTIRQYVRSKRRFFSQMYGDFIWPKRAYCEHSIKNAEAFLLALWEEMSDRVWD
jgi:hypothetical protein